MKEVGGGLDRLIQTESGLAHALATAQAEADRLLAEARGAAGQEEAGLQQAIENDTRALAARIEAERCSGLRRIAAEGEARTRWFRELPAAVIEELALEIAAQVLPSQASEPEP
jgi:hypothetical protein